MVSYNRLWETMEKRKISQYRLIKEFGLSSGQMSRLKKNTYVSTHTLETLCRILDCRIEDVMEVSFEDEQTLFLISSIYHTLTLFVYCP